MPCCFFFPDPALGFQGQLDKLEQLRKEIPNAHVLDQFANAANPEAHFRWTGSTDLCTGASDLIRE
jgi:cysteine synthase